MLGVTSPNNVPSSEGFYSGLNSYTTLLTHRLTFTDSPTNPATPRLYSTTPPLYCCRPPVPVSGTSGGWSSILSGSSRAGQGEPRPPPPETQITDPRWPLQALQDKYINSYLTPMLPPRSEAPFSPFTGSCNQAKEWGGKPTSRRTVKSWNS